MFVILMTTVEAAVNTLGLREIDNQTTRKFSTQISF